MKWLNCLCLAAALLMTGPLWGETEVRLSQKECVERGLSANRGLKYAALERDAARAAVGEMYSLCLPSLTLGAGYRRLNEQDDFVTPILSIPYIEDNALVRVELKQNVFTGFRIKSAIDLAAAAAEVGDAAFIAESENTAYAVSAVYLELGKAWEAEAIVRQSLETARSRAAEVKKLKAQGLATANDVLKADAELAAAELAEIDAQSAVRLGRARLNLLIGLPLETAVVPAPLTGGAAGPKPSLEAAVAEAQARRSELAQARGAVKAGGAELSSAASGFYPSVVIKGNYTFANPNPGVFPPAAEWSGTWEIGAAVSVDLGSYPQTIFKVESARRRLEAAEMRYAQVREAVGFEVLAALLDLERNEERRSAAGKSLAQAEENFRVAADKNKNGLAITSEVLDARLAFLKAALVVLEADYDRELSRLALLHRQGLLWQPPSP